MLVQVCRHDRLLASIANDHLLLPAESCLQAAWQKQVGRCLEPLIAFIHEEFPSKLKRFDGPNGLNNFTGCNFFTSLVRVAEKRNLRTLTTLTKKIF